MSSKRMTRSELRANVDKLCRCYDNGGESLGGSFDQYTVAYTNNFKRYRTDRRQDLEYVAMSTYPFHPQGFGQHGWHPTMIDVPLGNWGPVGMGKVGHLGKRIPFRKLPPDCKKVVMSDLREMHRVK